MRHVKLIGAVALGWSALLAIGGRSDMQAEQAAADDLQDAIAAAKYEMRARPCGGDEVCRTLVARRGEP